jgi:DNA-binding transcriptional MerR regulator
LSSAAFAAKSPSSKSSDAFRTISEVAAELDVPQHVLRFWESRFSQIRPVKRAGGRRFYRPVDVDLLRGIRALLYAEGLTIRGVQKLLKEKGPRHVAGVGRGNPVTPEPVVVEKIVYVERPAETTGTQITGTQITGTQAKKRVPHLRAIPASPPPMSLPFFDGSVELMPASTLPAEERARLNALLGELEGLKRRLKSARHGAVPGKV